MTSKTQSETTKKDDGCCGGKAHSTPVDDQQAEQKTREKPTRSGGCCG